MSRPVTLPIVALLAASLLAVSPAGAQVDRQGATGAPKQSFGGKLTPAEVATSLQTLIEQPAPAGLSPAELSAYQAHTEWLGEVVARLEVVSLRDVATGQASGKQAVTTVRESPSSHAGRKRQYAPIVLQKEYDALKQAIEEESLKFTSVSNVLKTRHDTAMASIRNLK